MENKKGENVVVKLEPMAKMEVENKPSLASHVIVEKPKKNQLPEQAKFPVMQHFENKVQLIDNQKDVRK